MATNRSKLFPEKEILDIVRLISRGFAGLQEERDQLGRDVEDAREVARAVYRLLLSNDSELREEDLASLQRRYPWLVE